IKQDNAPGTVLVFHGYLSNKSRMLDKAHEFYNLGYSVLLVDFMGSGGSDGHATTIGYDEAIQVRDAIAYLHQSGTPKIILFGTSMGAVAILRAIHEYKVSPDAIILECPFGTMQQTVAARFDNMNIPTFPMANLLVFWGGAQHGFWAFAHNPQEYAQDVTCATLLMYGAKDKTVSRQETDNIYNNIKGNKQLVIFPEAGHENHLKKYKTE